METARHLLRDLGLPPGNPHDLPSPTLRGVVSIPIDLYIESPDGLGGFLRYDEAPEIVRVTAPVYLKFGLRGAPNIYASGGHLEHAAMQTGRACDARLGLDMRRYLPYAVTPASGAERRGIPVPYL